MGPSLVLSSLVSMAEWNRASINSTFNNSGSSNDDDDDEAEGQNQQSNVISDQQGTQRATESCPHEQGPNSSQSSAVASFHSLSEFDSELQRQLIAPFPFRASAVEHIDFEVSTAALAQPEPTFRLDFSMSPLYTSLNVDDYVPILDSVARSSTNTLQMNLEEDEDDDRKPAAVASPRNDASQKHSTQNEPSSAHQKSRSISSYPFHSSSTLSNVEQNVPMSSQEQFIDPTFSFEDKYDARDFDDVQPILPNVWESSEHNDPKFNVHRRRHFIPPHADFTAPRRSPYVAAAPRAIAFRLGDENPDFDSNPSSRDIREVVDSVAATTTTRNIIPNRPSLPIATHQPIRSAARNVLLHRREATITEIESAETDRARSAIHVWYRRFNELIEYCERYGDCNVPQKYPPNAQLGIVRKQNDL